MQFAISFQPFFTYAPTTTLYGAIHIELHLEEFEFPLSNKIATSALQP